MIRVPSLPRHVQVLIDYDQETGHLNVKGPLPEHMLCEALLIEALRIVQRRATAAELGLPDVAAPRIVPADLVPGGR